MGSGSALRLPGLQRRYGLNEERAVTGCEQTVEHALLVDEGEIGRGYRDPSGAASSSTPEMCVKSASAGSVTRART